MALIVTRSPHFITATGLDAGATLTLDIGFYDSIGDFITLKTYSFTINTEYGLDVSPFISDYFQNDIKVLIAKTTINGSISGVVQTPILNEYVATDGYGYYEDGYNYDTTIDVQDKKLYGGCNDNIQVFADGVASIPLFLPSNVNGEVTIDYKSDGVIVDTETVVLGAVYQYSNDEPIGSETVLTDSLGTQLDPDNYTVESFMLTETRFITISKNVSTLDIDSIEITSEFTNYSIRVEADGGTVESLQCANDIIEEDDDADSTTHTLSVEYISECKYKPYKVSFINKIGVLEDLWFFKKSMESLSVDRSEFNQFTLDSYKNGILSNHSYKNFNVNGKEKLTLNTGFVPDNFRENFRQLMLSESVYVYKDSLKLPVNVSDSSIEYKTHVNDKLVNYTIEFDYAYDKINNLV